MPSASTLDVMPAWESPIKLARLGDTLRLVCSLRRAGGTVLDVTARARVRGRTGVVDGSTCGRLTARRSGIDTLEVEYGVVVGRTVIAVALPPVVPGGPVGEWMQVDSIGGQGLAWAPSARRNSRGQMEVYITSYVLTEDSYKGTLHRYVSLDGKWFQYDGVVLRPTQDRCTQFGDGIENVAIIPRSDGAGWRMLFAAGSNTCHGWQVYSAVSDDELTWRVEEGVRLDAGGGTPAGATNEPYWAQGEGMVVDRLPDGSWRMIQGGMERKIPSDLTFQITEWRSGDQLHWSYSGAVLTTREMPPEGQGSVYSPTIREFAPGLHRMIFTADDRHASQPRSRLWSAVSRDRRIWQLEGELLGAPGTDIWYSALVDERLVFIRRDPDMLPPERRVAIATVRMP